MNIAIVGTGYVGLVSGTCFADTGAIVTCVDTNADKIQRLQNNDIPIYEPGLVELVQKNVKAGRLKFTTDLASIVNNQEIIFTAVGTPPDEDGSADLTYVLQVAKTIGQSLNNHYPGRTGQAGRKGGLRRSQQPGVPQRGQCHQGLHEP